MTGHPLVELHEATSAPIVYGIVQPGPEVADGVPFVQTRDLQSPLDVANLNRTSSAIASAYRRSELATGDLLIALRGTIGATQRVPPALHGANISRGVARVRVGPMFDADFVRHALRTGTTAQVLAKKSTGSTLNEISIAELRRVPIPAPALSLQRQIAQILNAWDSAIDLVRDEEARVRLRYAETARLITATPHGMRPLIQITRELTDRNVGLEVGREDVMGVSNRRGIVPMREQSIASDLSRYHILPPRTFAYNPMRINVGSIAMSRLDHNVIVSPDYVLFACEKELLPEYLDHVLETSRWRHAVSAGASGSVRTRTYYNDLASIRIPVPSLEQQHRMVTVLDAMRDEATLLDRKVELLRKQKSGLAQGLLSGELRLNDRTEGMSPT